MIYSIPEDLPECPQCGEPIRQAERFDVSAFVEPCGHFIAAEVLRPAHVDDQFAAANGGGAP